MYSLPDAQDSANFIQLTATGDPAEALARLSRLYGHQTVFSTSFSLEDQLIAHWIFTRDLPIAVFTLDTGRLFRETYAVWSRTLERYGKPIRTYYPDAKPLEDFVGKTGPNAFYQSVALRKQCCHLRKVEPLGRALAGQKVWITGIRASHSSNRSDMPEFEWDPQHQVIKYHPLLRWTDDAVRKEIQRLNIPYNILHDSGFVSIGCAPCTRAVKPGEDFRAGRWWWEDADKKECGLHLHDNDANQKRGTT